MTVRRQYATALALAALLLGAGCGKPDGAAVVPEAEDPLYVDGKQLVRQGRNPQALTAFLKAIEKRGVQESAESHLEAGLIYLEHIKDFPEAIHHFRKFLELQPNSKDAARVRALVDTAKRAFARTLPACGSSCARKPSGSGGRTRNCGPRSPRCAAARRRPCCARRAGRSWWSNRKRGRRRRPEARA
jgi:tetratricopeptide (TPR) repeat protein